MRLLRPSVERICEDPEQLAATRGLIAALEEAIRKIEASPGAGLSAPRLYQQLARPDLH